jgi:hypothetical protein
MGLYDGFDDFDGDFDDYDGGDYEGDSYDDGGFDNDVEHNEDTAQDEPCCIDPFDWKTIAIIGVASEELSEEEKEKERIRRDMFGDDYLKDEGP